MRMKNTIMKYRWMLVAILLSFFTILSHSAHYLDFWYNNPFMWLSWLASVGSLIIFGHSEVPLNTTVQNISIRKFLSQHKIIILLSVFYFVTIFWNYPSAPWNHNGLFDDAAWDIYFNKVYVLTGEPFQPAFWDHGVSREIGYHYYLQIFFSFFGFNIFSYLLGLILLGYVNFIFTVKLTALLFKNNFVTVLTGLIMQMLPFHFIFIFVGHRYAIAAPLMMISLYYLYLGFYQKKIWPIVVSALAAGYCMQSAIMGKHFIFILIASLILYLIVNRRVVFSEFNKRAVAVFVSSFLVMIMPLIVYASFNPEYFLREKNLSADFMTAITNGDTQVLHLHILRLFTVFFSYDSQGYRWFLSNYLPLPLIYYSLVLPGFVIAVVKKNFAILGLATLPIIGALISGAGDFRVLHAVPAWILLVAHALDSTCNLKNIALKKIIVPIVMGIVTFGVLSGARHIHAVSSNEYSLHLFGQYDVAVARYIQDLLSDEDPNTFIERNEFANKKSNVQRKDTFICLDSGYAVPHLYTHQFGDKELFTFCGQVPMNVIPTDEIRQNIRVFLQKRVIENSDTVVFFQDSVKIQDFKELLLSEITDDQLIIHTIEHAGRSGKLYQVLIHQSQIHSLVEKYN